MYWEGFPTKNRIYTTLICVRKCLRVTVILDKLDICEAIILNVIFEVNQLLT